MILENTDGPGVCPAPELGCAPRVTPFAHEGVFASLTQKLPGSVGYFEILPGEERTQSAHQICLCVKQDSVFFFWQQQTSTVLNSPKNSFNDMTAGILFLLVS